MLREHAKTKWSFVEDVLRSPDVRAWQHALKDNLRSSDGFRVLSLDVTMKIATALRRYESKDSPSAGRDRGQRGWMTTPVS